MLVFQETFCIEATESEIVQVHRSPVGSVTAESSPPIACQAFAVVLKRDDEYRVLAAIHARDIKRSLIYAVQPAAGAPGFEGSLQQAQRFITAIGFELEKVSLKYSPAMREVILREIPVLLPPDAARRILQERAAEEAEAAFLVSQAAEAATATSAPVAGGPKEQENMDARIAAGNSAARRLAVEKRLNEQAAALRRALEPAEEAVNSPELAAAERSEREVLLQEKALAETRAAELEKVAEELREQLAAARKKVDKLVQATSDAAKRITGLEQELKKAESQVKDAATPGDASNLHAAEAHLAEMAGKLRRAEKEAASERAAHEKALQSLAEEKNLATEARKNLKAAEKAIAERTEAAAAAEKKLAEREKELQQALAKAEKSLTDGKLVVAAEAAAQVLIAELEEALQRAEDRAEAEAAHAKELQKSGKTHQRRIAELELALEKAQGATTDPAAEAAIAAADEQIATLAGKLLSVQEQLAAERQRNREHAEGGTVSPARQSDDRRMTELKEALRQEERRSEFLRLEVERFAAAKSMAEMRLAELEKGTAPSPAAGIGTGPKASSSPSLPLLRMEPPPPAPITRRPPPPGAFFQVDWDMSGIPVRSTGDLCEIHQSMSMVQLCLEGYPNQFCSAYVVVLKKGAMKEVYIPFRLSGSNVILVYVPTKQPDSQAALGRTMKEAAKFLQTVGMETEPVPLPSDPKNLGRELDMILSFDLPPKNAGNY